MLSKEEMLSVRKYPLPLTAAMVNVYNIDKASCYKHISSVRNASISYRSRTSEGHSSDAEHRRKEQRNKSINDSSALWGPPDKSSNFLSNKSAKCTKRSQIDCEASISTEEGLKVPPAKKVPNMLLIGKNIEMEFYNEDELEHNMVDQNCHKI